MKKIFIGLAVLAALIFSVAPSQALNSINDDVPGVNPLLPFFLVEKGSGLDTLFVIQEVGGQVGTITHGKTKGILHWILRNYKSVEVVNDQIPYTPDDVVPISVRDVLNAYLSAGELASLEITLGGKTYYTGYFDFENSWYFNANSNATNVNNLVAFIYLVDLQNGWAAASTAPVFEDGLYGNLDPRQYFAYGSFFGTQYLENFDGPGYAVSFARERNLAPGVGTSVSKFRLLPRYFLKDGNANTWIPIWSSTNKTVGTAYTYPVTVYVYDEDEDVFSKVINIPYELNWFDVRTVLPASTTSAAGWVDIPLPNLGGNRDGRATEVQWVSYSYQTASSASVGANWSTLYGVHRDIGTITAD
jgi:hypothetical protein